MQAKNPFLGNFILLASLITGIVFTLFFYNQQVLGIGFFFFYFALLLVVLIGKYFKYNKFQLNKIDFVYIILMLDSLVPALSQNGTINLLSLFSTLFGFYIVTIFSVWNEKLKDFTILNNFRLWIIQFAEAILGINKLHTLLNSQQKSDAKKSNSLYKIFWGIVLSLPLVFVYVVLFASSDGVFNKLISNIDVGSVVGVTVLTSIITLIALLNFSSFFLHTEDDGASTLPRFRFNLDPTVITTFNIVINFTFLTFIITQFIYLFGNREVTVSLGIVYSDYARQGFIEMIIISMISSLVILTSKSLIGTMGKKFNAFFNISLIITSVFNIIVLISAFKRLDLYVSGYGLTELRFYIYAAIIFFVALFGFIILALIADIIKGFGNNASNDSALKYTVFTSFIIALLIVAAIGIINPDATIARVNIQRQIILSKSSAEDLFQEPIDVHYLINNLTSDGYAELLNQNTVKLSLANYCNIANKWLNENSVRNNLSAFNFYKYLHQEEVSSKLKDYISNNGLSSKCSHFNPNDDSQSIIDNVNARAVILKPYEYKFTAANLNIDYTLTNPPYGMTISNNVITWTPTASQVGYTYSFSANAYDRSDNTFYTTNFSLAADYPFGVSQVTTIPEILTDDDYPAKLFDLDTSYPDLAMKNDGDITINLKFNAIKTLQGFNVSVAGLGYDGSMAYQWTITNGLGQTIVDKYATNVTGRYTTIDLKNICKNNSKCKSDAFNVTVHRNNGDEVVHIMELDPLTV